MAEQARHSADRLEDRLEFETLISDTSAALFAAPPERVDFAIELALDRVREFFQADRCALLSVSADRQVVTVRLASYADGVSSVSFGPQPGAAVSLGAPDAARRARACPCLEAGGPSPRGGHRSPESWKRMAIRSALTLPIETGRRSRAT